MTQPNTTQKLMPDMAGHNVEFLFVLGPATVALYPRASPEPRFFGATLYKQPSANKQIGEQR
jgi:hypothetical protein